MKVSTKLSDPTFREVDMTRIIYNCLLTGQIATDEHAWLLAETEYFDADIARFRFITEPFTVIHQLIEVKYNCADISSTINQIKKRAAEYVRLRLPTIEDLLAKDTLLAPETRSKLNQRTNQIESLLFHNRPSEGLLAACEQEKIPVYIYRIGAELTLASSPKPL